MVNRSHDFETNTSVFSRRKLYRNSKGFYYTLIPAEVAERILKHPRFKILMSKDRIELMPDEA